MATAHIAAQAAEPTVAPEQLAHYCLVRADLPTGTKAAMLIHAAGESSPGNLPAHTYAIALTCEDEDELSDLSFRLFLSGIRHRRIVECDPPYTGQLMAIGIPPMERSKIKPLLSQYPLVR